MHWDAVKAVITECEAYEDGAASADRFSNEALIFCIAEMARNLRTMRQLLRDQTGVPTLPDRAARSAGAPP